LVALVVLFLLSLSRITTYVLTNQLQTFGFTQASIEELDINLMKNNISATNLKAFSELGNGFEFEQLEIKYQWRELFDNRLVVDSMAFDGLSLHGIRNNNGSLDFGFQVPNSDEPEPVETSNPAAWEINLGAFVLANSKMELRDSDNIPLASVALDFKLNKLSVNTTGAVSLEMLAMEVVGLQVQGSSIVGFQQLEVSDVSVAPGNQGQTSDRMVSIGLVELTGLETNLELDEAGKLVALAPFSTVPKSDEPSEAASDPVNWRVGGIKFNGDNRLNFTDKSISPAVKLKLVINELTLGELDSLQADAVTPFNIEAALDDHNKIHIQGEASPLLASPVVTAKTVIEQLEISAFSPYMVKAIGYQSKTGQFNLESDLSLEDNQISSENQLRINKLTIAEVDQKKADEMAGMINLPLDTALNLIRDKNDDISLDIPISGDITNPDFAIGSVINTALGKALRGASLTYLKFAIQPWGAVWMVGEKLASKAQAISFDPVIFQEGSAEIEGQANEYLVSLAKLLVDKPFLRLTLCPVTTLGDGDHLLDEQDNATAEEQLVSLGTERGRLVKQQLVEQFKVAGERLFICPTSHDLDQKVPAVLVSM